MNIVPYENPVPLQEVATSPLEEFLQRIQNIILRGGQEFLIQRKELEKLSSLHLTQTKGNSQNFLITGLIQLREELVLCEKITQENLRKGLEFGKIFPDLHRIPNQSQNRLKHISLSDPDNKRIR